jgi:hypothetical protein
MTHDPREGAELEHAMLEHYRRNSAQEPSAELDARILAAAQAHAATPVRQVAKTPVLSRLHGWLFGGSQRARWSMAFASIATLGIGVGLALQTQKRAPDQFDAAPLSFSVPAPAPAAPVMSMAPQAEAVDPNAGYNAAPQADAAPKMEKKMARSSTEMRKQAPAIVSGELNEQLNKADEAPPVAAAPAPFADQAAPVAKEMLASKPKADAVHDRAQLQRSLQQILQLQRNGQMDLAKQQLHTLQQLHPQLDLNVELQRLAQEQGQH